MENGPYFFVSVLICCAEKSGASHASNSANEQQNLHEEHCDGERIGRSNDVMKKIVTIQFLKSKCALNSQLQVQKNCPKDMRQTRRKCAA